MVTTGILLRRLQRDAELPGVAAVVLDEVHERHLDGDLALALLVDVRAVLRPDLPVLAMSATVEAERTAAVLAGPVAGPDTRRGAGPDAGPDARTAAPVVTVPGATHPVEEVWCPLPARVRRTDDRGVTPGFLDHVAATVRRALDEREGDVLVFVPGVREIDQVARRLGGATSSGAPVDVRPLHGRLPSREQDLALVQGARRRVVVATAVAESSLTVPGVRVVVDAGLAREPRADHRRGLAGLVTVGVSRAAAEQRAGRAGREAPGAVYRCWSEADHARLAAFPEPAIRTSDLTSFALETACWGAPGARGLALLDAPPPAAAATAQATLQAIGAVDASGAVTDRGRRIAEVPVDPRLGRALLDGAQLVGARRAAQVVALLSDDVRAPGGDLAAALRSARGGRSDAGSRGSGREGNGSGGGAADGWLAQARRLELIATSSATSSDDGSTRLTGGREPGRPAERMPDDLAVGVVVALAHPDRVARLRPGGSTYLMVSGTGAALPPGSALAGSPWLAVADADRGAGRSDAVIRSAAPIDEETAIEAASSALVDEDVVRWEAGRVVARRTRRLGAIELTSARLDDPDVGLVQAAVQDGLRADGLGVLRWSAGATALRERLAFCHRALGSPWPEVDDAALLAGLDAWLAPDLLRVRAAGGLQRIDVHQALRRLLPWPEAAHLDALAPERLDVPSGSSVRVDYSGDQPVLAVRLQETFGWVDTPRLAGGRVPVLLHLLSPAGRPLAVTADLASFWSGPYAQVRAEMRGRYPKHAWPEDPFSVEPTRRVRRPREGRG
ncbi:ATP-dependent helicase HrpB [Paraoerskovia sediminicola]